MTSVDICKTVINSRRGIGKSQQQNKSLRAIAKEHQASQERKKPSLFNVRVQILTLLAAISVPIASWSQDINTSSSKPNTAESVSEEDSVNSSSSVLQELLELPLDNSLLLPQHVLLQHEYLPSDNSGQTSTNIRAASLLKTPAAWRDVITTNPKILTKLVYSSPHVEDGKLSGYQFSPKQSPESRKLFELLGLQAYDIITRVNNIDLNSKSQAFSAIRTAVKAEELELMLLRQGVEVQVTISFNENSSQASKSNPSVNSPKHTGALRSKRKKSVKYFFVTPYEEDGKLRGYRVSLEKNSENLKKYDTLPIHEGDIITSVNDIALSNKKTAIATLKNALKAQLIKLTVLRDGAKVHILLSLEN